jgi:hypothetical protein|tara:strand:- start:164 stop:358 length:195 start_codon:yes stop_codon:yes gene_type:complete
MAKSISGVEMREGKSVTIGDNRYGLREEYDPAKKRETLEHYRTGHNLTIKEIKNPNSQSVKTVK